MLKHKSDHLMVCGAGNHSSTPSVPSKRSRLYCAFPLSRADRSKMSLGSVIILTQTTITASTFTLPFCPLYHSRYPPSQPFITCRRVRRKLGLAVFYWNGWWIDVKTRNGIVCSKISSPTPNVKRWHGRSVATHQRFNLCVLSRRRHRRGSVAKKLVHVFEAYVGGFRIEEVYYGKSTQA